MIKIQVQLQQSYKRIKITNSLLKRLINYSLTLKKKDFVLLF